MAEREVDRFVVHRGGIVRSGGFREMWIENKAIRLITQSVGDRYVEVPEYRTQELRLNSVW